MITEKEYLDSKEIVKEYKLQLKTKSKKIKIIDLLLQKEKKEIIKLIDIYFYKKEYLKYSKLIFAIKELYNFSLNKKIGRNNSIEVIKNLIEKEIIVVKGDHGFKEYYLKSEING